MESLSDETIINMFSEEAQIPNLHAAAEDVQINVIKYLLLIGTDVNSKNDDGLTALQVAVSKSTSDSHYSVCKELIANGASVHVRHQYGYTPLHMSVKNENNIQVLELLISEGACINDGSNYGLKETPLHFVSRYNHPEYAELLISRGAQIDALNILSETPLHRAVYESKNNSHLDIIRLLLDNNANPNAKDATNFTPLCHILLCARDSNGVATNDQIVSLLLDSGADVNIKTSNGYTALHYAARENIDHHVTELLLSRGAEVDSKDDEGRSPLFYALDCNKNDCCLENIKVLLAHNANINIEHDGKTPLDYLINENMYNVKTLELFLDKNAIRGDTMLRPCLKMLLKTIEKKNADISEKLENKCEEKLKNLEAKFLAQHNKLSNNISDILNKAKKWHVKCTKESQQKLRVIKKRINNLVKEKKTLEKANNKSSMVSSFVEKARVHNTTKNQKIKFAPVTTINYFIIIFLVIILFYVFTIPRVSL